MELQPRLIDVAVPEGAVGTVIVLHGGASRGANAMVSPAQLSVLRMIPIAKRIAKAGGGDLAVHRLLNSRRGWDHDHTPLRDVRWALDELTERPGGSLPTCLVGHSLGGRAALFAACQPEVRGAVALAPWVTPTDRPSGLDGKPILIVHGSRDRIASPARSRALAERMERDADVTYVSIDGAKHAMLRRGGEFTRLAAEFAVATLLEERAAPVGAG